MRFDIMATSIVKQQTGHATRLELLIKFYL